MEEQDAVRGKPLVQLDNDRYIVQNPPAAPLSTEELDDALRFAIYAHLSSDI